VLELAQIHGAQVQGPPVALGEVIGAVHQAVEEHAVLEAEHMGDLVGEHPTAAPQQEVLRVFRNRLAVETRVIAGEAEDTDAILW